MPPSLAPSLQAAIGERFRVLTLWKNADPELQPVVKEVKRKADLLRSRTG